MIHKHLLRFIQITFLLCLAGVLAASEHRGQVVFGGVGIPGATVTAAQGDKKLATVTDDSGIYSFPDLADGIWSIKVEMLCFAPQTKEIGVATAAPAAIWEMKLLPIAEMNASTAPPQPQAPGVSLSQPAAATADAKKPADKKTKDNKKSAATPPPPAEFQRADVAASAAPPSQTEQNGLPGADASQDAANPYVVSGSASTGIERRVIGNNRRGFRSRYQGSLGFVVDNSALDARPFSMTGQDTHRSPYNHGQYTASIGGPLIIPKIIRRNAQFFANYTAGRNRNSSTLTGLMPSDALRRGDFSQALTPLGQPVTISDPTTGFPVPGNKFQDNQISRQAKALMGLYPLPNSPLASGNNYQIGATGVSNSDAVQARANKTLNSKNYLTVNFAWTRGSGTSPSIFGFLDSTQTNGLNMRADWTHRFGTRLLASLTYEYSRSSTLATPFFAFKQNVSDNAGITGNNQDPANYGPPTLTFASGIQSLTDGQQSFTRNSTSALSSSGTWMRSPHNFAFGADFRRQQFNLLSQQDARGTLTFTGAATRTASGAATSGSDFADFLFGVPDTVSIAYGNADKYLRANMWDAYFRDDWRVLPGFTLNLGARWEYNSPISERYGRLVNLDVAPGFTAVQPVLGSNPTGGLTGQRYPGSLVRPDRHAFQPRVAFAWHPFAAGSMVVRGSYGVYYNTSAYQSIAMQMAQQSPLSKSLSVANSAVTPLTLANPFRGTPAGTPNTFAIDPDYQVGYAQNWMFSAQQDVTASMVMTVTYLGIKGTRGTQVFLPNTYPEGAVNPCPACPSGFKYLASNGNSTRQAGTLQLRRRLHSGIAAALQYTYSRSFDDAIMSGQGGQFIAQNWLDLRAERGPSNFDQRHQVSITAQYTSGIGLAGGTLLRGWRGAAFKGWTLQTTITAGTGLPLTPVYLSAVRGTGFTGSLRPQATGKPVDAPGDGRHLNLAAYAPPPLGQWGNAGRNSITGPSQFSLNASLGRSFDRFDIRFDSTNVLNHVTYPSWVTTINSADQFGLPASANAMRTVQATARWRF